MYCLACGSDAIVEYNSSAGNSVCTNCGTVLEENAIVAEIQFGETSGGAAIVQGSYVGADQTRARGTAGFGRQKGPSESREQTMLNGRKKIQSLAAALRLPERLADAGQRYFNLAVNMNFVQGRRTLYVVAACLFCACRMDKTSHMLIDFSDLLEINVFVLGSTYLKLVRQLSLQLPTQDPSLYISRFAALLEFGDETQKVAQDAVRLVARMGRDWMHIGRRPAGVCGACLLLAARMNNFRRSVEEVVQVVKIADITLRKRLKEFQETPSGSLTVQDFRSVWLDEAADPPAFAEAQRKEREERAKKEEMEEGDVEGSVMGDNESQIARDAFDELANRDGEADDSFVARDKGKRPRENDEDEDEDDDEGGGAAPEEDRWYDQPGLNEAIAKEVESTLQSGTGQALNEELESRLIKRSMTAAGMTNLNEGDDSLDNLDEEELDNFILTPEESQAKSRLWMEMNKEYLQVLADKQTGPDGQLKPATKSRPRKKAKPRDSANAPGNTAAESTRTMLSQKKKISKKINYAALDSLFSTSSAPLDTVGEEAEDGEGEIPIFGTRGETPLPLGPSRMGSPRLGSVAPSFAGSRRARSMSVVSTFSQAGGDSPFKRPEIPRSSAAPPEKAAAPAAAEEDEEDEEEDEEEEEEEEPAADDDGDQEWRKVMQGQADEEAEVYDYDDEV